MEPEASISLPDVQKFQKGCCDICLMHKRDEF